jgi:hypothetical protein
VITDGPNNYASNANCVWVVTSTAPITVQFSAFSTEQSYDFVKLYNGGSAAGAVAASYSGMSLPPMFRSSGNTLTISFTSDSSVESSGFVATIGSAGSTASAPAPAVVSPSAPVAVAAPVAPAPMMPVPAAVPVVGAPPASLSGPCASIAAVTASTTPTVITDGPNNYASNVNCVWVVTSTAPITVQFSAFSTEQSYDFVKLYNGGSAAGAVAASYSGMSGTPALV